jgi:Fe-S oxidoreductase
MRMGEASLLPKVRAADAATLIIADGTSCRHQIRDGAAREALHVARLLGSLLVEEGSVQVRSQARGVEALVR